MGETKNQLYNTDLNLNYSQEDIEEKLEIPEKPQVVKKPKKEESKSRNNAF